jgi:gamma-glutamylcyclotransferase (GGCT)/AIG2-like uncharacterized protein YtfP
MAANAEDADSAALVFVYGSLKRGQANHHVLKGGRWLGTAALAGLALYDLGPFPMAIANGDATCSLEGEVYAVGAALLERLDRFEGAPRLYQRQAHALADGRTVWVYVGRARQVRHVRRIPSGCWTGPRSAD